ncbi:hypothetical protein DAPPUDRAFT_260330 [Daphnia pulex]|uniref:Uncharacterized protein n=1 Tax=Daphnia pulex TaxID=6669 RepID=E9HIY8_DAPPU|nr:hypothetical protein DAPPUDRAFT_260330 [Daphnia pulex]|eukprot:EFX68306.1 hypothetical protein DAPPUDRAFT_260330 [Daphnia pulex]
MKLFPIVFFLLAVACLAVAAAQFHYLTSNSLQWPKQEARDGICNAKKTPTKFIARRTWPSQTAITTTTTTAKPTTVKTTFSSTTTTAQPSTVSTTRPTTTTTMATTTTPLPNLFNCSVSKPGNEHIIRLPHQLDVETTE